MQDNKAQSIYATPLSAVASAALRSVMPVEALRFIGNNGPAAYAQMVDGRFTAFNIKGEPTTITSIEAGRPNATSTFEEDLGEADELENMSRRDGHQAIYNVIEVILDNYAILNPTQHVRKATGDYHQKACRIEYTYGEWRAYDRINASTGAQWLQNRSALNDNVVWKHVWLQALLDGVRFIVKTDKQPEWAAYCLYVLCFTDKDEANTFRKEHIAGKVNARKTYLENRDKPANIMFLKKAIVNGFERNLLIESKEVKLKTINADGSEYESWYKPGNDASMNNFAKAAEAGATFVTV